MIALPFQIIAYRDILQDEAMCAALDEIFFASSATKDFASEEARAAFRALWLTSYLSDALELAYAAIGGEGQLLGYVIGSHRDPAKTARAQQLAYFKDFAGVTEKFPAELHLNLAEHARGQGIGSALIARFVDDCALAGVPGVHVVTGASSRNISFYNRNGFLERGRTEFKGVEVVLLGRETKTA